MSSYTMQLRTIIEQASQYETGLTHNERIEIGRKKLFNFDYPIFDERYRKQFETNIIKEFYFKEIGFETEGRFIFELEHFLNLNMPYYNKLFESELIEFDPLESYSLETVSKREIDSDKTENKNNQLTSDSETQGTDKNTGKQTTDSTNNQTHTENDSVTNTETGNDFNRQIYGDTPENRLQLTTKADGSGVLEYATNITENASANQNNSESQRNSSSSTDDIQSSVVDTTNNTTSSVNNQSNMNQTESNTENSDIDESFTESKRGSIGVKTYSEMLLEYRETFIRIEKMIFKEMKELFMLVY